MDYETTIKKNCKDLGTYRPQFDPIIKQLAEILQLREDAYKQYLDDPRPVTAFTNREGERYYKQNPIIKTLNDLDKSALCYWRELSLTPATYKKLTGNYEANKPKPLTEADIMSKIRASREKV